MASDVVPERETPRISIVVPVLNEEEMLPVFYTALTGHPGLATYELELVFIDDGSTDATCSFLEELARTDPRVRAVSFSRNFGKEQALMAGLELSTGDAVIPMDVDLQDPLEVVPELIRRWQAGADTVIARRRSRASDSFFKRVSAAAFYRLQQAISPVKVPANAGDFRLLDRKVVEAVLALPERQLFMKGVFAWVGFDREIVEFDRPQRQAGKSKFNGWKLWNFALEGITSFSTLPLRLWTYVGMGIALFAFVFAAYLIYDKIVHGNAVPGYASLMTAILFLGGIQLLGIGILGEYIGRIYMETKQRPRYIVKKRIPGSDPDARDERP